MFEYQLDLNQRRIYYLDVGQGETILILHGNGADALFYQPLIQALSQDYRVLVPDLPGFGKSIARYPLKMNHYLADLEAFIQSHVSGPLHLIGHSLGAYIAYLLQLRGNLPDLKNVIWLEAALFRMNLPVRLLMPLYGWRHAHSPHNAQIVRARLKDWCWDNYNHVPLRRESFVQSYFRSDARVQGMFFGYASRLWPYRFEQINTPLLCIRGEKDTFISRSTDWLMTQIPGAQGKIIPQAGHFMLDENNEALEAAIREFMGARPAQP